nr:LINE-type retrotransposon LIb DNA [Ipomoea batatas]
MNNPTEDRDINGSKDVGDDNSDQTKSSSRTPPAQTKIRYGAWMLVTRKSNPQDGVANYRHPRKENNVNKTRAANNRQARKDHNGAKKQGNSFRHARKENNASVNHNNQFGVLSDLHDSAAPAARGNNAVVDNSKSGPSSGSKGKSPMASPTPQTPVRPPQPTPINAQPVNTHSTSSTRGRGGRAGTSRGRGRGAGRDLRGNSANLGSDSSAVQWNVQAGSTLFQFGNKQSLTDLTLPDRRRKSLPLFRSATVALICQTPTTAPPSKKKKVQRFLYFFRHP